MTYTILSYNVNYNQATYKIDDLLNEFDPDILVVQELNTLDDTMDHLQKLGYSLAGFSHSFARKNSLFGVVTFYKKSKFSHMTSHVIDLPFGLFEIMDYFLRRTFFQRRTTLKSTLRTKENKKFTIYNIHLSPYTINNLRLRQIRKVFETLDLNNHPTIILGDFNYPYRRKLLDKEFKKFGLQEATSSIFDTFKSSLRIFPFKLKLDYVLYQNISKISTKRLPIRSSDHYPLLTTIEL